MKYLENTKLWIYQADRKFTPTEILNISNLLGEFTSTWQAHGQNLSAGFEIRYSLFIILWVDENLANASGCSIDSSVRIIKEIEQKYGVDLFNRFNMAWKEEGKVNVAKRQEFEQMVLEGTIQNETIVFNNMVTSGVDFENKWEVTFSESWHAKVFATT